MTKVKIQHYVPRFYLKNFSIKKKSNYIINCFSKAEDKVFQVNIEKIGCEKYFYDIEQDVNQIIEKKFGSWETQFNSAYATLLKTEKLKKLSSIERTSMTLFLITQMTRTKENRVSLKDMVKQANERLSRYNLSGDLKKQLIEAESVESIKEMHISLITDMVKSCRKIVSNMKWILIKNHTSLPFCTSDNPVTRHNTIDMSPFGNLGLKNRGIEIYFPLSPNLVLAIVDPEMYNDFPTFLDAIDEKSVEFLNELQVFWSTRHLFSINNDFSFAIKVLKKYPNFKDENRKRMNVS